ncbi:hypothetical protein GCM10022284_44000 [Streptomyces hundungensis]
MAGVKVGTHARHGRDQRGRAGPTRSRSAVAARLATPRRRADSVHLTPASRTASVRPGFEQAGCFRICRGNIKVAQDLLEAWPGGIGALVLDIAHRVFHGGQA